eukprot:TRINITY_DN7566_c0_g1_i1.p1 TRINITY_DN7566_c0_g1~~TRINITY_DN7566_c0_g1_i1.p1  ORF type:complete len:229 (-),score=76.72 TRINITY_DN7566_c0_g1_i1:143-778(-)
MQQQNFINLLDSNFLFPKSQQIYTSCYCEENVYKLCEKIETLNGNLNLYKVAFISNPNKSVAIWNQESGNRLNEGLVIWDYHVILIQLSKIKCETMNQFLKNSLVLDLDTSLNYPINLEMYLNLCFKNNINQQFLANFRIIDALNYLNTFTSDRSHMLKKGKSLNTNTNINDFVQIPPNYPIIQKLSNINSNLFSNFVDMNPNNNDIGSCL